MANRLKELIRNKGFNNYQLSKALNVAPSTVTRWVEGTIVPRYDVLMRLCDLLECKTDDVLRSMNGGAPDGATAEVPDAVTDKVTEED